MHFCVKRVERAGSMQPWEGKTKNGMISVFKYLRVYFTEDMKAGYRIINLSYRKQI